MTENRQNRVLFLSVPDSLREQIKSMAGDSFSIDPEIPIPVEIPNNAEQLNLEELSWEMIISGMLRVIVEGTENSEWIGYYRHFVLAVRPLIMHEFIEAAILKARNGEFDLALEIIETLDALFPFSSEVALNRALVMDQAQSIVNDESYIEAYRLIQQHNEEEGLQSIRDFIERYPSVWNGWFILGWALRRLGRWQDAASSFGKAIELGGTNSDTRNELAICLMELGDLKGARRELETALHEDPENVKIISNLGVLALKSGNKDEAAAFFRTVRELDPEDPIANQLTENK